MYSSNMKHETYKDVESKLTLDTAKSVRTKRGWHTDLGLFVTTCRWPQVHEFKFKMTFKNLKIFKMSQYFSKTFFENFFFLVLLSKSNKICCISVPLFTMEKDAVLCLSVHLSVIHKLVCPSLFHPYYRKV